MLPRRLRLTRRSFPSKAARKAASEHFSLSLSFSREGGCAAVVSKAVAKRSVDRHLLKRRMLEVLRPSCSAERSLVVYARKGAPTLTFKALKEELSDLLADTLRK